MQNSEPTNKERNMNLRTVLVAASVFALAGCATGGVNRGHVVMKTAEEEAHVALGSNEVKVGDHVELYHNECTRTGGGGEKGGGGPRSCKKVSTGHGEVKEVLSPDYVAVKFPEGTKFTEGDTVEKHNH
jgi:hypothetical protein